MSSATDGLHWCCAVVELRQLYIVLQLLWYMFAVLAAEHPMSALSDDVQRPISDQRSLRHGARSDQHQSAAAATTRASWRQVPVWRLWQKIYTGRQHACALENCSRCWWRQDLPVWPLSQGLYSKEQLKDTHGSSSRCWCQDLSVWPVS